MNTKIRHTMEAAMSGLFLTVLLLLLRPVAGAYPLDEPSPPHHPNAITADGAITGIVIGDDTSAPIADVSVCAYQNSPYIYRCDGTDASGVYSISMPSGNYFVTFWPSDYHVLEYYDDVPYSSPDDRALVAVTDDTVTSDINASLAAGTQISGQVVDEATTNPLTDISIYVDDPGGGYYYYAAGNTDANGVYTTTPGLPPGSYRVQFNDYSGVYATEYYANAYLPSQATWIDLTGSNISGIDATLTQAAVITGLVTNTGPLNDIRVNVYFADENVYMNSADTDASGTYRLAGLAPIAYKLRFQDYSGQYLTEWHLDKSNWDTADPIPLTSGVTTTVNAQLVEGAIITGTVTEEGSGIPLEDIRVRAYDATTGSSVASDYTDAFGNYRLGGLAGGTYKLRFQDNSGVYLGEYHDNKPDLASADPVAVTAGLTATVDAQLTLSGIISGTVTDESSGAKLSDISITAYDAATGDYVNNTTTDASGIYRLGGLAAGNYKIDFYDYNGIHLREYYDNKPDLASADPIVVTSGVTTTANAALTQGAVISGTVTDEGNGAELDAVNVAAYDATTGNYIREDATDATGVYRIGGLAAGNYKLRFRDNDGVYVSEYYDDKPDFATADPITATPGMTVTANAALSQGGVLTGTVTDEISGAPLEDIYVRVYDAATNSSLSSDYTDAGGVYRIGGLAAGNYKLGFIDNDGIYISEYYDDKSGLSGADPITVTPGMTTTVNAALSQGGVISGAVTVEATGMPLENVGVTAYDATTGDYIREDTTDATGTYRIGGLATGTYKLYFYDYDSVYVSEYYDDKPNFETADPVTVTAGMTTTVDAALSQGGVLTGTVTDEISGAPLEDIYVRVYDATTNSSLSSDYTDAGGVYRIGGLAAGNYKLRFRDNDGVYLTEYYNDKSSLNNADPIAVTPGLTTTADAQLTRAGVITGTVTEEGSGTPLESIRVGAYDATTGNSIDSDYTDASGIYHIGGLVAGQYKLYFQDYSSGYLNEYYEDKLSLSSADPVTVTAGLTTTVDAALARGGCIVGRVTDTDSGDGIAGVSVVAERQDSDSPNGSATTDADGYYTTSALYTGVYRVRFSPPKPYYSEDYDGFRQGDTFTPVAVTAPLTATGVDAALHTGYLITGVVTGPGPLDDVRVYAYRAASSGSWASTYSGSDGAYQLGPLDPDSYRVRFQPDDWHTSEWYNDSESYQGSQIIDVTGDVTDINADLSGGGRITGTVTGAGGVPLDDVWVYVYPVGSESSIASGQTDATGHYVTEPGLANGEYQVKFSAPLGYTTEWYNDQGNQASADLISVTAGVTTTADAQLATYTWGAITGTITAADTGLPMSSMRVYAYNSHGSSVRSFYVSGGTYVLDYLPPDVYRVYFSSPPLPYVPIYYDTQPSLSDATQITVTAGLTVTNINQALPRGGEISGVVTDTVTGVGIPGVYVYAKRVVGSWATQSTYTGVDGAYHMEGLRDGSYKVQFTPPSPFIGEWHDDASLEVAAETVTVTAGTTVNVNAALAAGGIITGCVTAADTGAPLGGAYVSVYSTTGSFVVGTYVSRDGEYRTSGLPAGDYWIRFDTGPWSMYQSEWYMDAHATGDRITVTVLAIGVAPHVDALLDRGGSISGWIYGHATGQLLSSVYVAAYSTPTYDRVKYVYSNNWGFYQVSGLPDDQYKVYFSRTGYEVQWYDRAVDFSSALTITVSAPDDAPNVNAYLRYGYGVYLPLVLRNSMSRTGKANIP